MGKERVRRGFTGSNGIVQISDTGDRVSDYSLFDLNPKNGQFEVINHAHSIQLDL